MITYGYVKKIGDFGAILGFYNDVSGLLPHDEIVAAGLSTKHLLARVLKVRVTYNNPVRSKMHLAIQVIIGR